MAEIAINQEIKVSASRNSQLIPSPAPPPNTGERPVKNVSLIKGA